MLGKLCGLTVVLADQDSFEAGYVSAALRDAGATVIGPLRTASEVNDALAASPPPRAVVLGNRLPDGSAWLLARTLRSRGIAHLMLISPPWGEEGDLIGLSVLRKPFGAYQVVEWATQFAVA